MIGAEAAPQWRATDGLLAAFAERHSTAVQRCRRFGADEAGAESIWNGLNGPAFLRDDTCIARSLRHAEQRGDANIAKAQRRPPPRSLDRMARTHPDRDEAIVAANAIGGCRHPQIAAYFAVHFATVARTVRAAGSQAQ